MPGENDMGKTSRYIHHKKSCRKMAGILVLMLFAVVIITAGINLRNNSHAADTISIELDGNTVDPSAHIQMTTSSITLTLRSSDNIYNDATKYAINWTIESEEHQKRATIENGSSSIYGILTAKQPGEVQVMVNIVDKTSESLGIVASASCWVDIIFSVDTVHDDANFKYVYDDDTSRSLIMHTGDPVYQLGLAFGNAENCQWTSDNEEIVTVDNSGRVTAVGAGRTGIVVTYTPPGDTQTYDARLPVYVFPKVSFDGSNYVTGGNYGMASGDVIYTDAFFGPMNTETIQEKLVWVIKKDVNGVRTVIEDSLGNKRSDLIEITTLGGTSNTPNLVLNAKSGNYYLEFYPEGTYKSESEKTTINPTVINLTVYAELGNFDKTIIVNDAFNLAEAYNMTAGDFNNLFSLPVINLDGNGDATNYVSYASDTTVVTSKQKGTVVITVKAKNDKDDNVLNLANPALGLTTTEFKITLRIIDSFTLDRTNVVMYKGQTLQLNPTFTSYSGIVTWATTDSKTVSVSESGLLTALKETPIGTDVTITATLELDDGTIKKATCVVKVETSLDKFSIDPPSITIAKGDTVTLLAKFSGNVTIAPFTWKSTDPKICAITQTQSDGKSCLVTAVESGEAIIVLTNTENGVQSYCKVTVPVNPIPITGISLKNKKIEAKMYTEGVKIAYTITPANATETELIWESSDESVAKVDNTGLVSFVAPGTAYITVHPKTNPNQVFESCELKIIKTADSMTLSTTEHSMYAGETFTLRYRVEPENTELNVTFSSADTNIAIVDANTGLITARKAGFTQIFAKGEGLDSPAVCSLTVLQKSNAIAFVDKEIVVRTGETATAKVTLSPADSTDSVSWLSMDTKVATVTDGVITGVAQGATYVQAKTESGKDAIITVYVRDPVRGLALDKNDLKMNVGESIKLNPVFTPAEPYNKSVKWSTSNGGVATVDKEGNVKAEGGGVSVIKCISDDGGYQAICIVNVIAPTPVPQPTQKPPVSLGLNYSSYKLGLGKKITLKPSAVNVSKPKYTWKSSNKKIATVTKKGKVTGKKLGKCKITVTMTDSGKRYSASCTVRVIRKVTSIKLNKEMASILVGNTLKLSAIVKPAAATIKSLKWTTTDAQVATVDNNGNVYGVAPGIVKIRATSKDGSKKYGTCIVAVKEKVEANSIAPPASEVVIAVGTAKSIGFKTSPDNSTDKIYYTTDNKSVVAVTAKGKIYGSSVGSATVYATTSSGAAASVDVKVVGLNRGTVVMRPYDTETLWVNGFDSGVKWYSENPLIASVANGKVIGRKTGTTRIYAVVDGTKMSCVVKVTKLK